MLKQTMQSTLLFVHLVFVVVVNNSEPERPQRTEGLKV